MTQILFASVVCNVSHKHLKQPVCCSNVVCYSFQKLYDAGARFFWIHNTGPLGCLPQNIAKFGTDQSKLDVLGCVGAHNQAAQLFNLQLHALSKKLQGQYPDANVTYVDIYTIKTNLLSNYSRYGEFQNSNYNIVIPFNIILIIHYDHICRIRTTNHGLLWIWRSTTKL